MDKLKINDILVSGFDARRIIDVQDDYVVALLIADIDGPINPEKDNVGKFILKNDIAF